MRTLILILALPRITLQDISDGNKRTLGNGFGQRQRGGGVAFMTGSRNQYHARTDKWSHQVCGLVDGLSIVLILDGMGKLVKLTAIAVNSHKRRNAITNILIQSIPEQVAGLINVACLDGSGIFLIALSKPLLDFPDRINLSGKIIENLVCEVFLTLIVEIQGVTDMLPEVLDGLGYILEDITPTAAIVGIPWSHTL